MKLIDLSYFKNNMTSIEEVEVENYRNILEFVENYKIEKGEVDLSFLDLPNMKITYAKDKKHLTFSIGNVTGLFIYDESDREFFLDSKELLNDENREDIKEFLSDIKLPYVIVPKALTIKEKEAVYHMFMTLKKLDNDKIKY